MCLCWCPHNAGNCFEKYMMPKVSVIIPNFNHAAYLNQRIESVLNQTCQDFELIILDDCSTDNSRDIIETYRSHPKTAAILYNIENSGSTFKQWDKGINLARGEYIWIAESDDWCENNFLNTIVAGLEKNNEAVFGYCQSFCVNDTNNIIFQSQHSKLEEYFSGKTFLEDFLCLGNAVFNASMAVFKKRYYSQLNKAYQSFKFVGDCIFWAELSRLGMVYINAKPLNYFRKHSDDVSSKMYSTGENFIEELEKLKYFNEKLGLNISLYNKGKMQLYYRYLSGRKSIDESLQKKVNQLFISNTSLLQRLLAVLKKKNNELKGYCRKLVRKKFNAAT